jgi:hypothetical protein
MIEALAFDRPACRSAAARRFSVEHAADRPLPAGT